MPEVKAKETNNNLYLYRPNRPQLPAPPNQLTPFDGRHCDLARHFKTDPTETVARCFGYAKTPC
jgi:hypothetical protein